MKNSLRLTSVVTATLAAALVTIAEAQAHPAGHHSQRARIGASHMTPAGVPESWGSYCVTELAPLFREAISLGEVNRLGTTGLMVAQAAPPSANVPAAAPAPATTEDAPPPPPDAVSAAPAATPASDRAGLARPYAPAGSAAVEPPAGLRGIPLLDPMPPSLSDAPVEDGAPITVFVAKRIVTMDPGWPVGTAIAVKDGRILSVGSLADLKPYLDRAPYTIDLRFADKVIYPGFVEAHGHPVMGSVAISRPSLSYFGLRNPYGDDIPGVRSREDAFDRLKTYVGAATAPDETILTWGYDVVAMGGDLPTRAELDTISSTQPIIVWDASEHYVFANSAAITKYGVTDELVAATIGAGRNADGSSNGQFLGTEAAKIIMLKPLSEILTPEEGLKSLRYLGALMQQAGVTTTGDLFYGGVNLALEDELTEKYFGSQNGIARIVHVADGVTFASLYGDQALETAVKLRAESSERRMFNGVKFYADDAFVSLGMEMQWPNYIDADRFKGLFMFRDQDAFVDAMRPWWNAGFHIHVHSNGSGGNQTTLDALAALQAETPRFDHRFTFEHFGISSTAQGRQVKALGALVSTNPYYVSERADLNADQIGTDRASLASRMATLVDLDVPVSLHSDTPVGVPSPLLEVWTAVNRVGLLSGKVHAPHERVVDVEKAMRMVTVDAAYTLGVDDRIGSLEAGKFADMVVLDADPQEVDPMTIKDIGVFATILAGKATLTSATRSPDW